CRRLSADLDGVCAVSRPAPAQVNNSTQKILITRITDIASKDAAPCFYPYPSLRTREPAGHPPPCSRPLQSKRARQPEYAKRRPARSHRASSPERADTASKNSNISG